MKLEINGFPGASFEEASAGYLNFAGTAYLAMQGQSHFQEAIARFTKQWGTHWGASRIGNLQLKVYKEVESQLAHWTGAEKALTLSSGFLAARLLIESGKSEGFTPFYAPSAHTALLPPDGHRFPNWEELIRRLQEFLRSDTSARPVLVCDTLEFESGPIPLRKKLQSSGFLESLNSDLHRIFLIADDSHGLGLLGTAGNGLFRELSGMGFAETMVCASLGKAMGISGGVILGSEARWESLTKTPLFIGASPCAPGPLAALGEGLRAGWYQAQLETLQRNCAYLDKLLAGNHGISGYPDYPVFMFNNPGLADFLLNAGIIITHFNYPAEANPQSPSRIVVNAAHSQNNLSRLLRQIEAYRAQ